MHNLVELRKRNLSGLSPDHTAGIGYYSALLESIAGGAVPDTPFFRQFIELLEQHKSAAVDPDICSISRQLGRTPLFDRYICDLLDARPDIFSRIAECIHQDPPGVDDRSCLAWCRFLLEQGYRQDHEPVVRSVLEKVSPVEEINLLQLALSALYSGKGSPESVSSARHCGRWMINGSGTPVSISQWLSSLP